MTSPREASASHAGAPPAVLVAALADRYAIERELGRGGMATVYLARDLKHGREVAIKLLDPELGAVLGAERFLAEIRTTATLQHPNLLALFDSGEAGGLLYYVMPYVTGETLRARLQREKQLPVDEVVRIASAVASALEYAHGRGVIHRDLKPENILMQAGQPVVADFGIALAVSNAGGTRVTQTGLSLGTPQYMSPEQAMGDRVLDARSDVYALGAVCYEMLTGEPPHTGATAQAIIARLLTEAPRAPRDVRPAVPPVVDRAVRRALQKLPADRFSGAAAFADALAGKAGAALEEPGPVVARPRGVGMRLLSSPLWVVACVAAVGVAAWLARRPQPLAPTGRFAIPLDDTGIIRLSPFGDFSLALSPDGHTMAFVVGTATNGELHVRRLGELQLRRIPGTDGARAPVFSPDGQWIGFVSGGQLRKVAVDGGAVVTISDGSVLHSDEGIAWSPSGDIIFSGGDGDAVRDAEAGLMRIAAQGGATRRFTTVTKGFTHQAPIVAPDGETIVFTVAGLIRASGTRLAIARPDGEYRVLEVEAKRPLGFIGGRLVYLRYDARIMAVPVDLASMTATGEPEVLLEAVRSPALSASGSLLYNAGEAVSSAVLVEASGASTPLLAEGRLYEHPRYSPDGKRVAVDVGGASGRAIWIYEIASATMTRLTQAGSNVRPEWSPDGKRVLYRQLLPGQGLWWQPADGSGVPEQLIEVPGGPNEGVISPDGRTLLFRTDEGTGSQQVFTMPVDKSAKPMLMLGTGTNWAPRFSPDGRWIAYSSDESGAAEVYVRAFTGDGGRVQVSNGGGTEPVWSRDGRTLYYRRQDAVMAASLGVADGITVVARREFAAGGFEVSGPHASYDVAPDGKRLLLLQPREDRAPVILVMNWASEVLARSAGK